MAPVKLDCGGGRWIRTTELVREQIYSLLRLATSLALHDHKSLAYCTAIGAVICRREDLNPQPTDYKSVALPVELQRRMKLLPKYFSLARKHILPKYFSLTRKVGVGMARDGIEPPTRGFSVLCSTD